MEREIPGNRRDRCVACACGRVESGAEDSQKIQKEIIMIKVPFSLAELDLMADAFFKKNNAQFAIAATIQNRPKDIFSDVFDYIGANLPEIMKGRPDRLEFHGNQLAPYVTTSIQNFTRLNGDLSARTIKKNYNNEILKIFNYDHDHNSFTSRYDGRMAYDHAELLNLNCCAYCNAQFTYTIRKPAKTRPHFDHFYAKSDHPYFALSFYNLIPACYVCNSTLKGSIIFKDSTHLHPFLGGFENIYQFRTGIKDTDFVVNKQDFTLSLNPCKSADTVLEPKAKNNIKDFALVARYEKHKDIAGEIIKKAYFYNNTTIKELLEGYQPGGHRLFNSEAEIIELLMGNKMTVDRLHERIFSKLTRDVCDEFGISVAPAKN
ncbi:hypothetical protein KXQ82_04310 [Mucilaginibacter sp. HMF5004]|uniref:HNH endonuclease n=1 Tax=Mucilaginibacter rivuli TaxID=2857527 RepID=UPI001C5E6581|nr:hypothetical protein [Mucilaginibacter rivuli]MBW4888920.1 hypothetical protein [Mucilaginibacter rivuli]